MTRIITDYLEKSAALFADKVAFADDKDQLTFAELKKDAQHLAMHLITAKFFKKPIAVFLDKSTECISTFLGIAYSGNFYTPLDTEMPPARLIKIMTILEPVAIVTDKIHEKAVKTFAPDHLLVLLENAKTTIIDEQVLTQTAKSIIDTDLLYVLFTSGSTGMPKGVTISHRSLIDFIEWGTEYFGIDETYIFGNQTPFYFSMSVFDIFQTIKNGATTWMIPRQNFSFPILLMEYLQQHQINTLYWVPSALTFPAICEALHKPHVTSLRNIFFSGETMPVKHLNKWLKEYPEARYVNLYGPTELTDVCSVYEINRPFKDTDKLPIGHACRNMDMFLLNEQNQPVTKGEIGEICVRGTGLSSGYYGDQEKTAEAFVQNPLNTKYPETIYRTGDLAKINEFAEYVYVSRKDLQIKHMGHRIELGEIEAVATALEGTDTCCCIYNETKQRITLYYTGIIQETVIAEELKKLLPVYMLPNKICHLLKMPFNQNGKIDRKKLILAP
jgi:amino acid adenylation domain-containing protein